MNSGAAILKVIREKMVAGSIAALIVPSSDSHNSEYVAKHLQKRAFLTNFRGSAGTAVITRDKALLWTDGRYWVEAAGSMYKEYELMKQGQPDVPTVAEWIVNELGAKAPVGMDPYACVVAEWEQMKRKISVVPFEDVVGPLMAGEASPKPLYSRPLKFSGASTTERRHSIVKALEKEKCEFIVLSALDEVAWLTNLRGDDVEYNPVFYAYAVVDVKDPKVRLYVHTHKVSDEVRKACEAEIEILPYDQLSHDLQAMSAGRAVLVDERQTSEGLYEIMLKKEFEIKRTECGPAQKLHGIKNETELQGFRDCHVRDGAALTRYLAWLHDQIAVKRSTVINEFDAATTLAGFRALNEHFVQLSFESISSTGANGAMCHYAPAEKGSAIIKADQLYLIDSGAQYWDGTTDVTRTICFDPPRPEEMEAYTAVLKGHIALHNTIFPKGTTGHRLEAFARHALWDLGLDYAHGTGHGVGSMLCVHEGPFGIGSRPTPTNAPMELHQVTSNEPGYYKEGHFGIRIENLEEVVEARTKYGENGFLTFAYLTMAPLCRDLIDATMLTEAEKAWVNTYHNTVVEKISRLLEKDSLALAYLAYHTQPI